MKCPICKREFDPADAKAAKPFCSERCRLVDLGRWLGESYSLPSEDGIDADDAESAAGGNSGEA